MRLRRGACLHGWLNRRTAALERQGQFQFIVRQIGKDVFRAAQGKDIFILVSVIEDKP